MKQTDTSYSIYCLELNQLFIKGLGVERGWGRKERKGSSYFLELAFCKSKPVSVAQAFQSDLYWVLCVL